MTTGKNVAREEYIIEVMQHYINGSEVEVAINGEWECANPPIWGWDAFDY